MIQSLFAIAYILESTKKMLEILLEIFKNIRKRIPIYIYIIEEIIIESIAKPV